MRCRFCHTEIEHRFISLGATPLSNAYLAQEELKKAESFYPLEAYIYSSCFLVQVDEFETPKAIFGDYAYFSSYSETWFRHAKEYVEKITARLSLNKNSQVVEIASNDGYLLQYFLEKRLNVLGVEPAENVAKVAREKGIPTEVMFFGTESAQTLLDNGKGADLLLANNVLAHVPNLNDFVEGLKMLLNPKGIITVEFPHLMHLIEGLQFDTIYHEHFSYFSFITAENIFAAHGMTVFDLEELPTHGGSLRLYVHHKGSSYQSVSDRVHELREREINKGHRDLNRYLSFPKNVLSLKRSLLDILIRAKNTGKTIVGYGAPAKGNTLLNYCGIGTDFLDYTVDRNPAKQGSFLPGTHIPIRSPDKIKETKPDFILILPWNIKDEIIDQISFSREWGCQFIIPIPKPTIV